MQGIAALPTQMAPEGMPQQQPGMLGNLTTQEAATLGRLLSKVSGDEIEQLRELASDLKEFSLPELKDFLGGVDYIMGNAKNYQTSVKNLIMRGVVEPGDLPAEYVPTFFSILRQMIIDVMKDLQSAEQPGPEGFAKGGLVSMAEKVRKAGRHGDTMLAHITPREAAMLKASGGAGTINPKTGLPEYKSFFSKVGSFLKKAAPVLLPIALSFIPGLGTAIGAALGASAGMAGAVGSAVIGAVGSGVGGLIAGQKPGQALLSAALGGLGGFTLAGGFTGGQGISGLFSGGATGAEGATNAASFQSGAGGVNPTVGVDTSGAASSAADAVRAAVPMPPTRPIDLPTTTSPTASTVSGGLGGMFDSATNWVKANPLPALAIAGVGASMLASGNQKSQKPSLIQGPTGEQLLAQYPEKYQINPASLVQPKPQQVLPTNMASYQLNQMGQLPGWYSQVYAKDGGHINGPGTGTSDDVPAMLSDGEFVLTAKAVRGAGDGSRIKGAKRLYKLMNQLEKRA